MKLRRLAGTDLDLSVVGVGCWAMGGLWWGDDVRDDDSIAAIHRALDVGINWFDTAPLYGHGHADEILVRALGPRLRDVVIATKVGVRWDGEGMHARSDLTPEHVRADVEASLRRLGLERLDLVQVHWPCELGTPLEATLEALYRLRDEGKVRYLGLCNYSAPQLRQAAAAGGIDTLQTPYSMLRREFEAELQPLVLEFPGRSEPLSTLAYEPLCRGLLTGKFNATSRFAQSDLRARDDRFQGSRMLRALTIVSRLQLIAKRHGAPLAALAIAWALRQPGMTLAIAGAKRADQVAVNAQATDWLDREDLWADVDRVVGSFRG